MIFIEFFYIEIIGSIQYLSENLLVLHENEMYENNIYKIILLVKMQLLDCLLDLNFYKTLIVYVEVRNTMCL